MTTKIKIHDVEAVKLALAIEDDTYLQELLASAWEAGHSAGDVDCYYGYANGRSVNPFLEEGLVNRNDEDEEEES